MDENNFSPILNRQLEKDGLRAITVNGRCHIVPLETPRVLDFYSVKPVAAPEVYQPGLPVAPGPPVAPGLHAVPGSYHYSVQSQLDARSPSAVDRALAMSDKNSTACRCESHSDSNGPCVSGRCDSTSIFWGEDPLALFDSATVIPDPKMDRGQKFNTVTRLLILIFTAAYVVKGSSVLNIFLFSIIILFIIYYSQGAIMGDENFTSEFESEYTNSSRFDYTPSAMDYVFDHPSAPKAHHLHLSVPTHHQHMSQRYYNTADARTRTTLDGAVHAGGGWTYRHGPPLPKSFDAPVIPPRPHDPVVWKNSGTTVPSYINQTNKEWLVDDWHGNGPDFNYSRPVMHPVPRENSGMWAVGTLDEHSKQSEIKELKERIAQLEQSKEAEKQRKRQKKREGLLEKLSNLLAPKEQKINSGPVPQTRMEMHSGMGTDYINQNYSTNDLTENYVPASHLDEYEQNSNKQYPSAPYSAYNRDAFSAGNQAVQGYSKQTPGAHQFQTIEPINRMNGVSYLPKYRPVNDEVGPKNPNEYTYTRIDPQLTRDPETVDRSRAIELPPRTRWTQKHSEYEAPAGSIPLESIYDPRFTGGGGDPYRTYEDINSGRIRYYYRDLERYKYPLYVARSNNDNFIVEHTQYKTPMDEVWTEQTRLNTPDYRDVAENQYHADTLQFRESILEGVTRKDDRRRYQLQIAPQRSLHNMDFAH